MKNLINYNRVVFIIGAPFTKLWMITMPIFATFVGVKAFLAGGWPVSLFTLVFMAGYAYRNYNMISNLIASNPTSERELILKRKTLKLLKQF